MRLSVEGSVVGLLVFGWVFMPRVECRRRLTLLYVSSRSCELLAGVAEFGCVAPDLSDEVAFEAAE